MDARFVIKIVEAKVFDIKVIVVYEADGQLALVAGVDDELDQVDRITRIADRVDIYIVINFSGQGTFVTEWQVTEIESKICGLECQFQN